MYVVKTQAPNRCASELPIADQLPTVRSPSRSELCQAPWQLTHHETLPSSRGHFDDTPSLPNSPTFSTLSSVPPTPPPKDPKETPTKQGPFCYSPDATRQAHTESLPRPRPPDCPAYSRHTRSHSDPQVEPQSNQQHFFRLPRQLSLPVVVLAPTRPRPAATPAHQDHHQPIKRRPSFLAKCNDVLRNKLTVRETKPSIVKDKVVTALQRPFPPPTRPTVVKQVTQTFSSAPYKDDCPAHRKSRFRSRSASATSRRSYRGSASFPHRENLTRPPPLVLICPSNNIPDTPPQPPLDTVYSDGEDIPSSPSFDLPSPVADGFSHLVQHPTQSSPPDLAAFSATRKPSTPGGERDRSISFACPVHHRSRSVDSHRRDIMYPATHSTRPDTGSTSSLAIQRPRRSPDRPSSSSMTRTIPLESMHGFYDPRARDRVPSGASFAGNHSFRNYSDQDTPQGSMEFATDATSSTEPSTAVTVPDTANMLTLTDSEDDFDDFAFVKSGSQVPRGFPKRFIARSPVNAGDDLPGAKARRILGLNSSDAGWEIGENASAEPANSKTASGFQPFKRISSYRRSHMRVNADGADEDDGASATSHSGMPSSIPRLAFGKTPSMVAEPTTVSVTKAPVRPEFRRAHSSTSTHTTESVEVVSGTELSSSYGAARGPMHSFLKARGPSAARQRPLSSCSSDKSSIAESTASSSLSKPRSQSSLKSATRSPSSTKNKIAGLHLAVKARKTGERRWWDHKSSNGHGDDASDLTMLSSTTALGLSSPVSTNSPTMNKSSASLDGGISSSRSLDFGARSIASPSLRSSQSTQIPIHGSGATMGAAVGSPQTERPTTPSSLFGNALAAPRTSRALARVMMSPDVGGDASPRRKQDLGPSRAQPTNQQRRRLDAVRKRLHSNGRSSSARGLGLTASDSDSADKTSRISLREKMLWEMQLERGQRDASWQSMIEHRPRNRQQSSNAALEGVGNFLLNVSSDANSSKSSLSSLRYVGLPVCKALTSEDSPSSEVLLTGTTLAGTPRSTNTEGTISSSSSLRELHDEDAVDVTLQDCQEWIEAKMKAHAAVEQEKMYSGPSIDHLASHLSAAWPDSGKAWGDDDVEFLQEQERADIAQSTYPPRIQPVRAHSDGIFTLQQLAAGRREWPSPLQSETVAEQPELSDLDRYLVSHSSWLNASSASQSVQSETENVDETGDAATEDRRPSGSSNWTLRASSKISLPLSIDSRRRDSDQQGVQMQGPRTGRVVSFGSEIERAINEPEVVDPMTPGRRHKKAVAPEGGRNTPSPALAPERWQRASMWSQESQEILASDGEEQEEDREGSSSSGGTGGGSSVGAQHGKSELTYSYEDNATHSSEDTSSACNSDDEGIFVILPPSPDTTSASLLSMDKDDNGRKSNGGSRFPSPIPLMVDVPTPPRRLRDWPSDDEDDEFDERDGNDGDRFAYGSDALHIVQCCS